MQKYKYFRTVSFYPKQEAKHDYHQRSSSYYYHLGFDSRRQFFWRPGSLATQKTEARRGAKGIFATSCLRLKTDPHTKYGGMAEIIHLEFLPVGVGKFRP